jgi:PIN domain nuclease of toxin-antitoxin system
VSESYLLDTNVLYWIIHDPGRLSTKARKTANRGQLIVSVASYWEITIKSSRGKLPVKNPLAWWERAIELAGAEVLPIRVNHVSALHDLPEHHRDPFDRMIVAQAVADGHILIASDPLIHKYPVRIVW